MSTEARFLQTDAQHLAFADRTFDAAVATFVFCSVPDPVLGLSEVKRVVRRHGKVLLLEHVRINAPVIGPLMDLLDPVSVRVMGPHIARRTVKNVQKAGLVIDRVEVFAPGALVKLIHAHVP
jgi:ubiquinone/menaquinone biosynthesis C-methylase UbiE